MRKMMLMLCSIFVMMPNLYSQNVKVMLITGGHSYDSTHFFNLFDRMEGIEYQHYAQPEANESLTKGAADAYDVLVFYDMWKTISEQEQEAYVKLTKEGKPFLFLHHALVSYQQWPEFEELLGGRYIQNKDLPVHSQSTYKHDVWIDVEIVDKKHPVTAGLDHFKIFDEVYGNFNISPAAMPLLRTNHPESSPVIGWENRYNASSVVYLQPGHDKNGYENDNYRKMVKQAVIYLAGKNKSSF